jgi:16S rRNA A1518/A1519 N6-dimethyltransferase RsmA/KsgA/DIM1 with predicted DNA glycosylase/AP lyase activity
MSADNQNIYFGRDLEAMSFAENYHNWIIDEYKPYLGANVAEVGAGTGNFTELLLASETQIQKLVAYEPSSNMYPILEKRWSVSIESRSSMVSLAAQTRIKELDLILLFIQMF